MINELDARSEALHMESLSNSHQFENLSNKWKAAVIDLDKIEPEIKGLLGVVALAPLGFLLMALFFYLGAFERINIGILLFIIGVSVFLGAIVVSKKAAMKTAQNMAIGGLVLLLVEGVCAALMIRSVFHS